MSVSESDDMLSLMESWGPTDVPAVSLGGKSKLMADDGEHEKDDMGCVAPDADSASLVVCLRACTAADGELIGSVPYGAFLGYEPNLPAPGSHNAVGFG